MFEKEKEQGEKLERLNEKDDSKIYTYEEYIDHLKESKCTESKSVFKCPSKNCEDAKLHTKEELQVHLENDC